MKCKHCNKEFEKKSYQQKFCCNNCKEAYWNKRKPNRHKDKDYYRSYNILYSERLERIGIDVNEYNPHPFSSEALGQD